MGDGCHAGKLVKSGPVHFSPFQHGEINDQVPGSQQHVSDTDSSLLATQRMVPGPSKTSCGLSEVTSSKVHKWCSDNNVSSAKTTVAQIADFLLFLRNSKKLSSH